MRTPEEARPMTTAAECRQYAETCRAMAVYAKDDAHRQQLLTMAEVWENFAIARERWDGSKDRCER